MKRRDEVTVGILLTVALIVLITGTLWLVRGGLRRGYPLYTSFPWGQSLKQGQAVMLSGVTVGYVANVELNPTGVIDVDLNIQKKYQVPRTAVAEVYPVGIFGDVAVALKVTAPSPQAFQPGDTVPSRAATSGLDALQARADSILISLGRITHSLEAELVQNGALRDIRQTVTGVNRLVTQLQTVTAEQNRNMSAMLASLRNTASALDSARIASTLQSFRGAAANVDSLTQRLSATNTQVQAILARIERGEGNTGKLMADSALYNNTRNLLVRIDSLVADFQKNPKKYLGFSIF